jgi:hypothetical protein
MQLIHCSNLYLDYGCVVVLIDMKSASLALHCPRKNNPVLCQLNNMNHHEAPQHRKMIKRRLCEGRKELAHTKVRLQLILFSKITGAFFSEQLVDLSTNLLTQIYCLTGAIVSETHITNIYFKL